MVGLLVLLPLTRPLVRRPLERALSKVAVATVVPGFPQAPGRPPVDGVIRGEVIDEHD